MIRFTHEEDSLFMEGITSKKNQLYFAFAKHSFIMKNMTITVYCNFNITAEMAAYLNTTGLIINCKSDSKSQQFKLYLAPNFPISRLKTVLNDFVKHFSL